MTDLGRDVIDDDDAVGAAVVGARNRPEPLLAWASGLGHSSLGLCHLIRKPNQIYYALILFLTNKFTNGSKNGAAVVGARNRPEPLLA